MRILLVLLLVSITSFASKNSKSKENESKFTECHVAREFVTSLEYLRDKKFMLFLKIVREKSQRK